MRFNFTRLHAPFMEALRNKNASVAFSVSNGRGRFVFLLFVPSNNEGQIQWKKLDVFIILGRTQSIINPRLKGFYTKGCFNFDFSEFDVMAIRGELGLEDTIRQGFSFSNFCSEMNNLIPQSVPMVSSMERMKEHASLIRKSCSKHIEHPERIYLLSHQPLPANKRPRAETLRKLSFLTKDVRVIDNLIKQLRAINWTLKWTDVNPGGDKFAEIWEKAMGASAGSK